MIETSADGLALAGIAFIALFALWKLQVSPRLQRRHEPAPNV
jgi:hypothetical protein